MTGQGNEFRQINGLLWIGNTDPKIFLVLQKFRKKFGKKRFLMFLQCLTNVQLVLLSWYKICRDTSKIDFLLAMDQLVTLHLNGILCLVEIKI